jgi:hypothetical protein
MTKCDAEEVSCDVITRCNSPIFICHPMDEQWPNQRPKLNTDSLSIRIKRKQTKYKRSIYIAIHMYTYPPYNFSLSDFLLFHSYLVPLLQSLLNNTTKSSLVSEDVSWRHSAVTSKNSTSLFQGNKQIKGEKQKGGTCVKSIREFLTNESIRKKS